MRIIAGILTAGLVAGFAAAAHADADGFYVGAETGLNIVPQTKLKNSFTGNSSKLSTDPGYAILGQAGYAFGPMRVEGELGWRANGADKLKYPNGISDKTKGSLDASSVFANAYYDFHNASAFTPFIGVGIGGVDVNADKIRDKVTGWTLSKDDAFVFGYQGIAGASYALNDNLSLKADYRYLRTTTAGLKDDVIPGTYTGKDKGQYSAHSILVGFTYKFGAPAAPAPVAAAPVAAPVPAPAPKAVQAAPIAKNYQVFFDFNKSDITPEANSIISQAANAAKTAKATSISLIGHTDAAGSEKYNMALSIRRGNAVKAALVRLGIPANEISVVGKGKGDQLVATKDGVREPQNRRVQIILP